MEDFYAIVYVGIFDDAENYVPVALLFSDSDKEPENYVFRTGGPTEEGYSYEETTIWREGLMLYKSVYSSAKDCDGPIESWVHRQCPVEMVEPGVVVPWHKIDGKPDRQRDYYAEQMNY